MLKERHKHLLSFYSGLHSHRRNWFDARLRFAAILLTAAVFWLAYNYFTSNYPVSVNGPQGSAVLVSGLLFNTFVTGALFGFILFAGISEGEYLLGLRKIVYNSLATMNNPGKKSSRGFQKNRGKK